MLRDALRWMFASLAVSQVIQLQNISHFEQWIDANGDALIGVFATCGDECEAFRAACNRSTLPAAEAVGELARLVLDDVEGAPEPQSSDNLAEVKRE
jgi:hypothetical protein